MASVPFLFLSLLPFSGVQAPSLVTSASAASLFSVLCLAASSLPFPPPGSSSLSCRGPGSSSSPRSPWPASASGPDRSLRVTLLPPFLSDQAQHVHALGTFHLFCQATGEQGACRGGGWGAGPLTEHPSCGFSHEEPDVHRRRPGSPRSVGLSRISASAAPGPHGGPGLAPTPRFASRLCAGLLERLPTTRGSAYVSFGGCKRRSGASRKVVPMARVAMLMCTAGWEGPGGVSAVPRPCRWSVAAGRKRAVCGCLKGTSRATEKKSKLVSF